MQARAFQVLHGFNCLVPRGPEKKSGRPTINSAVLRAEGMWGELSDIDSLFMIGDVGNKYVQPSLLSCNVTWYTRDTESQNVSARSDVKMTVGSRTRTWIQVSGRRRRRSFSELDHSDRPPRLKPCLWGPLSLQADTVTCPIHTQIFFHVNKNDPAQCYCWSTGLFTIMSLEVRGQGSFVVVLSVLPPRGSERKLSGIVPVE